MAVGEINARPTKKEDKAECENTPLVLHLGVFFDGSSPKTCISSSLSSLYTPPNDEIHKRMTMTIGPCECPSLEQQCDIEKLQEFGSEVGEILNMAFNKAQNLLTVYLANAENITVEIDTFCVEDGFFTASLFCEVIEPGCYDEKPFYAEHAVADLTSGIFEDLRMRGATIKLNSFTTFQLPPDENNIANRPIIKSESKTKPSKETELNHSTVSNYSAPDKTNYEYIRSNEDKSLWFIKNQGAKYEGLYSNLCTAKEWLENTALTCDIVAISTSITGIGLPAGAVAEVVSMGASGLSAIVCFTLATMDSVNGDEDSKQEHLVDATWNSVGAIPFGTIIAKAGKGAKFTTKVSSVSLKPVNNVVEMYPSRPKLTVKEGGKPLSESTQIKTDTVGESASKAHLSVIQGGKRDQIILKQANGSDIVVTDINSTKNLVVLDSIDDFRPINYFSITQSSQLSIDAGSHFVSNSAHRISKNDSIFTKAKSSEYPEPIKPVEDVDSIPPADNNVVAMSGDSTRLKHIKDSLEHELEYMAMLNKRFIQTICKKKNINIE